MSSTQVELSIPLLTALAFNSAPVIADTFVIDSGAGTNNGGALFRVDPAGSRTLISDFGNAAQGPLGIGPQGLALEPTAILVTDTTAGTGGFGTLLRVNPANAVRTLVSNFGNAAQGPLGAAPQGVAVEPSGTILIADFSAGPGGLGALFRVDPAGSRTLISDFGNAAQGPLGSDPGNLALEGGGTVLVNDSDAGTNANGGLFRIDLVSGIRALVSDFGNATQGPEGVNPTSIAVEAGGTALVVDQSVGVGLNGALFRVDLISGTRTLISDFGNAAQGPLGVNPRGVALEAGGTALVIDDDAGTNNGGALFRVDSVSGVRTLVSDFGNAAQGTLGVIPAAVAVGNVVVVPPNVPNCFGRVPTIVGDDGNNVLTGSPGNDVVTGLGGADRIDGKGGNDRICGGNGKDRLRGGSGRDLLDGGAGSDRINGGKGTDRCRRGERETGCER